MEEGLAQGRGSGVCGGMKVLTSHNLNMLLAAGRREDSLRSWSINMLSNTSLDSLELKFCL